MYIIPVLHHTFLIEFNIQPLLVTQQIQYLIKVFYCHLGLIAGPTFKVVFTKIILFNGMIAQTLGFWALASSLGNNKTGQVF